MQHFEITDQELSTIIQTGLNRGADYVDIYMEHSAVTMVGLQNADENRASQNIDYGAGVRVVRGDKTGYAYTEEVSYTALLLTVEQAAFICMSKPDTTACVPPLRHQKSAHHYYECENLAFQPDGDQIRMLVEYLRSLRSLVLDAEPDIVSTNASIIHKTKRWALANSLGQIVEDEQPLTNVSLGAVITRNGKTERANTSRSYRRTLEMLTPDLQHELAETCVRKLHFALTAVQPKGGEMPVVLGAGASGILLHEAIGHAFEADFVRRGESIFSDQLGKLVCDPAITVVDDGTLDQWRGSIHYDDEGVPSQKTEIVSEGRLTSFLHDRISARCLGANPTGNGRRESFRFMPMPRMRNTYMLGGQSTEQDLIASVKNGIFVDDFSNGQVQIGAGDYSFYVKGGYLIEDGHLTRPVKDLNIIGNGPQTLADIRGVANNLIVDPSTWQCGKEGQSCPVSCGMPSVLVEKLTVG